MDQIDFCQDEQAKPGGAGSDGFRLPSPVGVKYAGHMADWIWALVGVAVTLSVTAAVILWYAFKHLDDKIECLDDKMDRNFDQIMAGIAETKQLVASHA